MKRTSIVAVSFLIATLPLLAVVPSASAQSIPAWAPNTAYATGALVIFQGTESVVSN